MNKDDLTLCMIVKNEAKGLRIAVESARESVGRVVIGVDIAATDDTIKIARELTPDFFLFQWENDFAAARNIAAEYVHTPYYFVLDGHEILTEQIDFNEIKDEEADGYLLRCELESGTVFLQPRLFKKDVRWRGKVHNTPILKNPKTLNSGKVLHDREHNQAPEAIKERAKQRDKMMHDIMEKALKKDKRDTRAAYQLGMFWHAKLDFKKALKFYNHFLKYSTSEDERFVVNFNSGLCYYQLGKIKEAEQRFLQGLNESGKMWEFNLALGTLKAAQQKHEEAIKYLVESFDLNTKPQRDFPIKRNPAKTWDMIANEFFQIKKYAEAAQSWKKAAEQTEDPIAKQLYTDRSKLMCDMAINCA